MFGHEIITISLVILLTVVAPGPDFVVVVRNSLCYSRRAGILASVGVSTAVWIHVTYAIIGTNWVLTNYKSAYSVIQMLGGGYLLYLGIQSLSGASKEMLPIDERKGIKSASSIRYFLNGFINNAINPKASIFFISLFSQVARNNTPLYLLILYGAITSVFCLIWFSVVSILVTGNRMQLILGDWKYYVYLAMGCLLIIVGLLVVFTSVLS